MKLTITLLITFGTLTAFSQNKTFDYCYSYGPCGFHIFSVSDKKEYILDPGNNVCEAWLSPNGKKIVGTFYTKDYRQLFVIIDLNTRSKRVLNPHCQGFHKPIWSPNGALIAYEALNDKIKKYDIAVINPQNGTTTVLTKNLPEVHGASWTSDSKYIVANDRDSLFVFDLSGKVRSIYKINDFFNTKGEGGSNFMFTTDKKKIVFLQHVKNEFVSSTGGVTAIFVYDIKSKKILRLSPNGYECGSFIIHDNRVLFDAGDGTPGSNVYSVDLDGKNFGIFFRWASKISASD